MNSNAYNAISDLEAAAEAAKTTEELRAIVYKLAHLARTIIEETENLHTKLMIDELTGIPSYEAFKAEIEPELHAFFANEKRRAYPYDYLFIVADMDGLSTINNTQGHAAGDTALRNFAQVLYSSTRAQDWVGRSGKKADEFIAIIRIALPENQAELRSLFIERMQKSLEEIDPTINASFGIAIASEYDSLAACRSAADDLMYVNKEANYARNGIPYKPNRN